MLTRTSNRKRLALSLAGTAAAAMLTFVACKKEATEPLAGMQPVRENLETRIISFVERANSHARDGGTMITADSAEWYVEAALNYSNADLTIEYNDAEVDSITYTIPLNNGMADEADAIAAYHALNPVVAASNDDGISHVVIVDVTSQNTVDELILTVAYVVGSGYEKALNTSYNSNDFWLWRSQTSSACSTNTQQSNQGADKRIQGRINNELTALGQNVYMVSVETWIIWTYNDEPNKVRAYYDFPHAGSPHGYETYACAGGACTNCLSPSMMSYYTQHTWDVMVALKNLYCPTKKAQQCTITGEIQSGDPTLYFHKAEFRYGVIPK